MIINNKIRDVHTTGVGPTTEMRIDASVTAHIIKVVTKDQYKNPLSSHIREATSNGVDSHLQAGTTDPVVVSLQKNSADKWILTITDVGLGLDDTEFEKYIMGIGESTKRDNPLAIGGFGAGAKCWLGYTSSANYICVKDGIERKYLIFEGQEVPEKMLISENFTTERNGVSVSIELQTGYYEQSNCITAIKEQLAYLPNVFFDVYGIRNDYKIHRTDLFQWNTLLPLQEMHLSLKNIYYPINWKALGMGPISLPVAIRFDDYSEIMPILSREEIKWDEQAKEAVKTKVMEVCTWFMTQYNQTDSSIELKDILKNWERLSPSNSKYVQLEGQNFCIDALPKITGIESRPLTVKGIEILSVKRIYELNYEILSNYRIVGQSDYHNLTIYKVDKGNGVFNYMKNHKDEKFFICQEAPSGIYKQFLADEVIPSRASIFKKNNHYHSGDGRDLDYYICKLYLKANKIPKDKWRQTIKDFLAIEQTLVDMMVPLEQFQITDEWRAQRKAERIAKGVVRTHVKKEEVNLRSYARADHSWKTYYEVKKGVITEVSKLKEITGNVIFGKLEDKDKLHMFLEHNFKVFLTSDRDIERIKAHQPKNWMTYEEFMEGNTRFFRLTALKRQATTYYSSLFGVQYNFVCEINPEFAIFRRALGKGSKNAPEETKLVRKIVTAAENTPWLVGSQFSLAYPAMKESADAVDISFLEHIRTVSKEGMTIAKEIYYIRQKEKQMETSNHPHYI